MIRKIKNIIYWLILVSYVVLSMIFISGKRAEVCCSAIEFEITDNTHHRFITRDDIIKRIYDNGLHLINCKLDSLNMEKTELLLKNHPSVKNAEVYSTKNGIVKIDVEQRNPIIRIINNTGKSCYIDESGELMPFSENYTAQVVVANGNIKSPLTCSTSSLKMSKDTKSAKLSGTLESLYKLACFLIADDFWNSQIEQIYVTQNNEFELIPRVGSHLILLGNIENMEQKFQNLKGLYQKGFKVKGWNNYSIINLKYKNQVVCTKR